jgi:hypothetical protein
MTISSRPMVGDWTSLARPKDKPMEERLEPQVQHHPLTRASKRTPGHFLGALEYQVFVPRLFNEEDSSPRDRLRPTPPAHAAHVMVEVDCVTPPFGHDATPIEAWSVVHEAYKPPTTSFR